jgi:hypothetical protein
MNRIDYTKPAEDFGALAQSRFFYQHQYTAYWCIQMLIGQEIERIICEYHEDLVICWKDGHYEFIQVKTRGEGQGEWSLANLLQKTASQSILEKLYAKKVSFGDRGQHLYVFVSNMGASGQSNDLHTLKKLTEKSPRKWDGEEKNSFEIILDRIRKKKAFKDADNLRGFCLSLRIRTWQPDLQSIGAYNIGELQKALKEIHGVDYPYEDLKKIYDSILQVVHRANVAETREGKTIWNEHIESVIEAPARAKGYLERVKTDSEALNEVTTLQRKAQKARFDSDVITLLMDLRASANAFYRKYSHFDLPRKRLQHLSLEVQRLCVDVKLKAQKEGLDGIEQWFSLQKHLRKVVESKGEGQPPIDLKYLIGVVGDLAGKCKVGWDYHE